MMKTSSSLTLFAAVALSVACTDRSPTGPAMAAAGGASPQAASSLDRVSAPRSLAPRQSAPNGLIATWGGEHVRMTIGTASTIIQYDCAHGTIDQPFAVDAAGHFDLAGTHVMESPGPIRQGDEPVRHPARYKGSTDGKVLTFTVTLTDTNEAVGPFVVTLGAPGHVTECL